MVVAIMETPHFEFVVFGENEVHAENLMNKAFAVHMTECDVAWEESTAPSEHFGCRFFPVLNGVAFRDGEEMNLDPKPRSRDRDPEEGYANACATHAERFSGD